MFKEENKSINVSTVLLLMVSVDSKYTYFNTWWHLIDKFCYYLNKLESEIANKIRVDIPFQ